MLDLGGWGRLMILDLETAGAELMIEIIKLEHQVSFCIRNIVIKAVLKLLTFLERILS